MTAARHALAEGDPALAAQRLIYARDADPRNPVVLRQLTRRLLAGGQPRRRRRAPCATGRASSPTARRRTASPRASTRTCAPSTSRATPPLRETARAPTDASAWERLGRLRLRLGDRQGAQEALERARAARADGRGPARPRARAPAVGDVGAEVTACEAATLLAPESPDRLVALRARARAHRPRQRRDRGVRARADARPRPGGAVAAGRAARARAARAARRERRVVSRAATSRQLSLDSSGALGGPLERISPAACASSSIGRAPAF